MTFESFLEALRGLRASRLRSMLTVLGMTIGTASVIVLVAVGNGSSQAVSASIQSLGTNVLLVQRSIGASGPSRRGPAASSLTLKDVAALQAPGATPDVASVSPVASVSEATMVFGSTSYSPTQFVGSTASYLPAHDYKLAAGRLITGADESQHARVLDVGQTVASELFSGADPVGQTVAVDGVNFTVVGLLAPKGSNGTIDEDDIAIAPLSAVQDALTGYGSLSSITVQAKSAGALDLAQAEVTQVLDRTHNISATGTADFSVVNQGSLLSASNATSSVFTTLLGEVAAVSLLVGGIGVMNIMLVSVTERTREIGIRKAIGARRSDILSQFLSEAVLLSLVGGLLGVGLALLAARFQIAGVHPIVAAWSVGAAFGASACSGLLFGVYPAWRAAAMNPIDALRHE